MPVITVNDQQYALHPGQNRLGAGDDADVRVVADAALGVQAIVDVVASGRPVIRRASATAAVRVNGVALIDPTPLIHGDKVEIGGSELLYSDDDVSGVTRFVSTKEMATLAPPTGATSRPAAPTGGRLVSLVDGKEYPVTDAGLTIGRDASCAVVIAQTEVSRKHAVIQPTERGYELRDLSSNGVVVNGSRIDKPHLLSRSDVIRIGSEEFRFHGDAQSGESEQAAGAAESGAAPPPPPPPPPAVAEVRSVLAILQVSGTGPSNGQVYEIRVPLVHVGRGAHNDVAISDESVSDSHAKLHCRDGHWFLTDLESTNGTYAAGQRLTSERMLDGMAELRFGGVKMTFRPADIRAEQLTGTRSMPSVDRSKLRPNPSVAAPVAATAPTTTPAQGLSAWVWGVVVLALVAAAAFFLLNR